MLDPWFQRHPSRRIKAIRNWFYWKLLERHVISDAKGILFTSEEEMLLARETFTPYSPKAEIVAGYGIAEPPVETPQMEEAFRARCPSLPKDSPFFIFLSRVDPKKGVDLLLNGYQRF